MLKYERRLRVVARRFNVRDIDQLPKEIYNDKVIKALNKIRDNRSASTMVIPDPIKIGSKLAGGSDAPLTIAVGSEAGNPMGTNTPAQVDDIANAMEAVEPVLDEVENAPATSLSETRSDLVNIIANKPTTTTTAPTTAPTTTTAPTVEGEQKSYTVGDSEQVILTGRGEISAISTTGDEVYYMADNTWQLADNDVGQRFIIRKNKRRTFYDITKKPPSGSILTKEQWAKITTQREESDQKVYAGNRADKEAEERAQKALEDGSTSTADDTRAPDPTSSDQLIDPSKELSLKGSTGAISGRTLAGETVVYMQDGTWEPIDTSIGRGVYAMPIDSNLLFVPPVDPPRGISQEQWAKLRKKAGASVGSAPDDPPRDPNNPNAPAGKPEGDGKQTDAPPAQPIPGAPAPGQPGRKETMEDRRKRIKKGNEEDDPKPPIGGGRRIPREPKEPDPPEKFVNTTTSTEVDNKNRTGGISMLRPFFTTFHGLDLLTQTDKEAMQDIAEFDLFDLPIPDNDSMENPLFVHNLQQKMMRFNGLGNPANAGKPAFKKSIVSILSTNQNGSITSYLSKQTLSFQQPIPPTQNPLEIVNPLLLPTYLGGGRDGAPWKNAYENNYNRGFGEAERKAPSYTESIVNSLYENPDIYNSIVATDREPQPEPYGSVNKFSIITNVDPFSAFEQ